MTLIVHSMTGVTQIKNVIAIEETKTFFFITTLEDKLENTFTFTKDQILVMTITK